MEPLTINGPIPFGRHRDGTVAAAQMRFACVAIVGEPNSGKTILEHNLCCGLIRCPDALVWMVDLSRGGLANAYLNPLVDGDVTTPPVDWIATDPGEAHAMTQAACDIIGRRRAVYRQWMKQRRTDKLPLTHDLPAIYILIDEGKKVTGARADLKLLAKIIQVADEGRAMGVRLVITGLRGTSEVIPSELMADIGCRIGMSVASAAEANYLFGWNHRPNPRDTPYPGCGLWRHGLGGPPTPFRSYDLSDPTRIARLAVACEPWRPTLDEPSLDGLAPELREWYLSRWERAAESLGEPAGSGGPAAQVSHPSGRVVSQSPSRPMSALDRLAAMPSLDQALNRVRRARTAEGLTGERLDERWADLAAQLGDDRAAGGEGWADDGVATEPRARMLQLVDAAGGNGVSGPKLREALAAEGHDVPMTTLYRWLKADAVDGGYSVWHSRKDIAP